MMEERRDWATRPDDIWRCEDCGYWEARYKRQVNAIPTCPHCCSSPKCVTGYCTRRHWHKPPRLWAAVRLREIA